MTRAPPAQTLLAHTIVNVAVVIRETERLAPASPRYLPLHQVRKKSLDLRVSAQCLLMPSAFPWGFCFRLMTNEY